MDIATCEICGKEYDNYFRTYYIEENHVRTRVCTECRLKKTEGKYYYTNHVPTSIDGASIVTHIFPNKLQLLRYIHINTADKYIACIGWNGNIVDVHTEKKFWWVRGNCNLNYEDLPDWRKEIIRRYKTLDL